MNMTVNPGTLLPQGNRQFLVVRESLGELCFFAYGANMNEDLMRWWEIRPAVVSVACLPGHALSFHGHSGVWDGGVETIVPAAGAEVWGVLYKLDLLDGERLDASQDVRFDGGGAYFHFPVGVTDAQGLTHLALTYKKDVLESPTLPSREYLSQIIEGAAARGLPLDYVESLRCIDSKPATYPVPARGKLRFAAIAGDPCAGCTL